MGLVQRYRGGGRAREIRVAVHIPEYVRPSVRLAWAGEARLVPVQPVIAEIAAVKVTGIELGEVLDIELWELWECAGKHCCDVGCWSEGSMGMWIVRT